MTMTKANTNSIADGVPMNLVQMRLYLQDRLGAPVALREHGKTAVTCPWCQEKHEYSVQPGWVPALCEDRSLTILINDRVFVPGFGMNIYEYKNRDGVNELLVPVDELVPDDVE